jgi:A/G-specific adenine glycosylase
MMHRCAQQVMAVHGGRFPASAAALATLPGIGRSTAAAVAAFCFGERAAILDGNVKRVLTRVLAFGDDLATARAERRLWQLAEALLPEADIDRYTQGLMDLGATVCLARRPACGRCPVQSACAARAAGEPERYPVKTRRVRRGRRAHVLGWIEHAGRVWLVKRPDSGVWAAMWCLPAFEADEAWHALAAGWPGMAQRLPAIAHALTHFDWHLQPARHVLPSDAAAPVLQAVHDALAAEPVTAGGRWFTREEALAAGLPAPVRKLLA